MLYKRIILIICLGLFISELFEPTGKFVRAYKIKNTSAANVSCGDFLSIDNCNKASSESNKHIFEKNYTSHKATYFETFEVLYLPLISMITYKLTHNYTPPYLAKYKIPPIFSA